MKPETLVRRVRAALRVDPLDIATENRLLALHEIYDEVAGEISKTMQQLADEQNRPSLIPSP